MEIQLKLRGSNRFCFVTAQVAHKNRGLTHIRRRLEFRAEHIRHLRGENTPDRAVPNGGIVIVPAAEFSAWWAKMIAAGWVVTSSNCEVLA